jgi:hypothetical protein
MVPVNMISWISAAFGMGFLVIAICAIVAPNRQARWKKVPSRIIRSRVEYRGEEFAADVAYTYSYDGVDHTGNAVSSPQIVYNWRGPAERICARYPEGATVTASVHPEDPTRSVLEPPGRIGAIVMLLVSAVCLLFALALMWAPHTS